MSALEGLRELCDALAREDLPAPREVVLEDAAFDALYRDCAGRCSHVDTTASARARAEHVDRFRVLGVDVVRHRPMR